MSALELITFYGFGGAKWIQVAGPRLGHGFLFGTRIPMWDTDRAWDSDPCVGHRSHHGIQIPVS